MPLCPRVVFSTETVPEGPCPCSLLLVDHEPKKISRIAQRVKNPSAMQETQEAQVWSLGLEDPLEKEMATHSSIFAWKFPWTEEPKMKQFRILPLRMKYLWGRSGGQIMALGLHRTHPQHFLEPGWQCESWVPHEEAEVGDSPGKSHWKQGPEWPCLWGELIGH